MALSAEAIIALITLVVTCPPSLLLIWVFLKRTRRTLLESRLLPRHQSQSVTSQISNRYNPNDPNILFDNIFYRRNIRTELPRSYNSLSLRSHHMTTPMTFPQSTIEGEPTFRQRDARSERFEGTIIVEQHSVTHASLTIPAHTVGIV
ncbi:hypothetical protein BGW36DRAFT_368478 [Talaromyces proteolyticus]|uniref:Uncharacterized protein n=1 Tax=Talaromyces proteolyticus TaxID=1131652 RepID=A0AAD4L3K1_9EURO|nr:uncharacterized protein BGW36DRAFT_368478 [Talaromyces proteolyticus]KAH8705960.1 hypothetical protein BGW36DRAFT_368478 [Talaromyces proteolyticus]